MTEEMAVNKPVAELLVPADAEAQGRTGFAAAVAQAADGHDPEMARSFVRPWNTFGVRMRARIATCGPPRAALVVLEDGRRRCARRRALTPRSGYLAFERRSRRQLAGCAEPVQHRRAARPTRPAAARSPAAR